MLVDNSIASVFLFTLIALNIQSFENLGSVCVLHTSVPENLVDGHSTGSVSTGSAIRTAGVLIENQIYICGFSANYAPVLFWQCGYDMASM
jgi:hypothetical protein